MEVGAGPAFHGEGLAHSLVQANMHAGATTYWCRRDRSWSRW